MSESTLPVIQSCEGCGACCMEMGTPPGFAIFFGHHSLKDLAEYPDAEIMASMPQELRDELLAYYVAAVAGKTPWRDDPNKPQPCLWFDTETKLCRNYEHRPTICRTFELGEPACHRWRKKFGINEAKGGA
jgi:Fe-S-cluster containining protein